MVSAKTKPEINDQADDAWAAFFEELEKPYQHSAIENVDAYRTACLKAGYPPAANEEIHANISALEKSLGFIPESFRILRSDLEKVVDLNGGTLSTPTLFSVQEKNMLRSLAALGDTKVGFEIFARLSPTMAQEINSQIVIFFDKYIKKSDNRDVKSKQEEQQKPVLRLRKPYRKVNNPALPRWAEENRSTVQINMRFSRELVAEIDRAAENAGQNRTEWFIEQISKYLATSKNVVPANSPEYRGSKSSHFRVEPEFKVQIEKAAKRSGLNRSEWIRRVSRMALAELERQNSPDFSIQ